MSRRGTLYIALYRLYLGIADGMSGEAVILSTGTPIPAQWTCRRRRRDAYNSYGPIQVSLEEFLVLMNAHEPNPFKSHGLTAGANISSVTSEGDMCGSVTDSG